MSEQTQRPESGPLAPGRLPKVVDYVMPDDVPHSRARWPLEPTRAALLIHDMQAYFLRIYPAGSELIDGVVARIRALRTRCDELGIPVFYTAQFPHQDVRDRGLQADLWGPGMRPDASETEIVEALRPLGSHEVLRKWRYSAFQRSPLEPMMTARRRDQLIVVGVYAQIGVLLTAADAFMRDVRPFVVADAVADFSADRHRAALEYVGQHCGIVTRANDLLETL